MKKCLTALVPILLALCLCACGESAQPAPTPAEAPVPAATTASAEAPAPAVTTAPADIPTFPEPSAAQSEIPTFPEASDEPAVIVESDPAEDPGTPVSLSATEQYEANLFLSNFSEQNFGLRDYEPFEVSDASEAELFAFAHLWAKLNRRSAIAYVDSYETMTLANVNDILDRYFGTAIHPASGTDYSAAYNMGHYDWDHVWYENGVFYYPAADGESYCNFSVVTECRRLSDGSFRLYFTVYAVPLEVYWKDGIPSSCYRLTPDEAAKLADKGDLSQMFMGEAVAVPYALQGGRQSYQLVSYRMYFPD